MSIFNTIFHSLQAPMAVIAGTEDELRFIHTNDAFNKLIGYTEEELINSQPKTLFSAWNNPIGRTNDRSGCFLLQLKINRTMRIHLTWEPIANTNEPTFLLIAEDITAKTWIEMMGKSRKVLLSGIVSKDFIIERYIQYYPAPMFDYQVQVENQSVFEFLNEEDRDRLMRIMKEAVDRKQTGSLVVCSKRIANMAQLELHVTFCPFYCGNGSLKHYGFVVTDIQPVLEQIDPSVSLKILMARKHMSAQQLAELTGISLQTISKLRNGKIGRPQRLTAELIAAELNVSPQDIWPLS